VKAARWRNGYSQRPELEPCRKTLKRYPRSPEATCCYAM
jgi:hypothetical protein